MENENLTGGVSEEENTVSSGDTMTEEELLADRERIKADYSDTVKERYDEACDADEGMGTNIVMLHDMEDAMIGTMENEDGITVAVYERELCIKAIANRFAKSDEYKDYDEAYEAALEWFEYNTVRALPYIGKNAPVIISGFMVDSDRWEGFLDEQPGAN